MDDPCLGMGYFESRGQEFLDFLGRVGLNYDIDCVSRGVDPGTNQLDPKLLGTAKHLAKGIIESAHQESATIIAEARQRAEQAIKMLNSTQ